MKHCDYCLESFDSSPYNVEFGNTLRFCCEACMYGWRREYYALTDCATEDCSLEDAIGRAINE